MFPKAKTVNKNPDFTRFRHKMNVAVEKKRLAEIKRINTVDPAACHLDNCFRVIVFYNLDTELAIDTTSRLLSKS